MKQVTATLLALVLMVGPVTTSFGYTKPNTYSHDRKTIVFKNQYIYSPHAWIIVKAIDLLRHDGYIQEADAAQKHLLPMLEGVTFNDVWGDADLAGGSVLDYYIPDNPDENYGYGHVLSFPLHAFAPYKNSTHSFKTHPLYGYENAAEHAQFRYDYAVRIANGHWGDDSHDFMAGWVNDTLLGQDDPQDGRYASGAGIDTANHTWGNGQTAATAFLDMLQNHSFSQVVFPDQTEDALSTIYLPEADLLENHSSRWFDDHFGDADDIEAFNGYDNHGYAVYASWTRDASGHCNGGADCAAPMIVRLPVRSNAHAFFQLGWSLHLLEDVTTPVHTINGSFETFEVHNDVETRTDEVLASPGVSFNGQLVRNALPALTKSDFTNLYSFHPTSSCADKAVDPAQLFASRRYSDRLPFLPGEGVAHAYVRNLADISHTFIPYIKCIDTESDSGWDSVGFFTASGLDTGIKGAAGLMHQFMADAGMADTTAPVVSLRTAPPTSTNQNVLSFTGSATDTGSTVKSVEYSFDDGQTWNAANPIDGAFSDDLTERFVFTTSALPDGTYAIRIRATDVSNNVTPPASQPRKVVVVDTTPPAVSFAAPVAGQYSHSATLTLNYSVTDNLSGVRNFTPTLDGATTVAGHGLASGQAINLLTELTLGYHTFMIAASDNANNNASRSVTFSVVVTPDSIKDDVSQFFAAGKIKNQGLANSLTVKLNAAAAARTRGNCQTAANNYQAFINEVQAQTGKGIDSSAAQVMIADAQYLIAHCP